MNSSIRLGRIAGIRIGMHWSVPVLAWLVGLTMVGTVLPQQVPGLEAGAYWVAGMGATVLFFASLLGHEVAHAVVARRNGLPVDGITLWFLGGVSKLRGEPASAGADFRIAAVGPLVSVVLGLGFGGLALGLDAAQGPEVLAAAAGWVAGVNLIMGAVNLVPAAPLDGGRILRAALWRRSGDRTRAALAATRAGRMLGLALMAVAVGLLVSGSTSPALWLALVGLYIATSAAAEQAGTVTRSAVAGLRVEEVGTPTTATAPAWLTVEAFLERQVLPTRSTFFVLADFDGSLAGTVTLAALTRVPAHQRDSVRVRSVAVPMAAVTVTAPDEPVQGLLERLTRTPTGGGHALVVQDGRLVGLVSPADIARAVQLRGVRADTAPETTPGTPATPSTDAPDTLAGAR